jgi:ketosteroid isomerase-like protein
MSQENVEIVQAFIDAWNRGDWDATSKDFAPDFELDFTRAVGPNVGIYGIDQYRRLVEDFVDSWEAVWIEPHDFIEAGEHVVVPWTMHARGREGIDVQTRANFVWTIRDAAIVRVSYYEERQEALEAVGLSE